ncbi:Uncharacterised protein [Mycobacteroides abscessus subsp. abscessus]|nr:Uncharacterised protein [Mycobacteroides abscessus subsp. abscessus]
MYSNATSASRRAAAFGMKGVNGSSAHFSSGASRNPESTFLVALLMPLRSVVSRTGSIANITEVIALAR